MSQLGLFAAPDPVPPPLDAWLVEDPQLGWVPVEAGRCRECSRPGCAHEVRVQTYKTARSGDSVSYTIRSAFHKEVRRGDTRRALAWARQFMQLHGIPYFRDYCKKIVFEETRDFTVWAHLGDADTPERAERLAVRLAAAPKKWQQPYWPSWYFRYIQAADRSATGTESIDHFWAHQRGNRTGWLEGLMDQLHQRHPGAAKLLDAQIGKRWGAFFYVPKVAIELLEGLLPEPSVESLVVNMAPNYTELPHPPAYVFDNHTSVGLRIYRQQLSSVAPGRPLPPDLDLRWSGMIRGAVWRTYAAQQFGDQYVDTSWEQVRIPIDGWVLAMHLDRFFYPEFR